MMKNSRNRYFVGSIILLVVVFLSIGYSAFQTPLLIDGMAVSVRLNEDIRVTGIKLDSATDKVISSYEDYNVHNLFAGIYLPNADSSITYKIEVTNFGNVEMGIFAITGLPNNLTYELKEYELKEKVCENTNKCTLGAKKEFYITIKYASNGYDSSNLNYTLNLNVDFRGYHKVVYNNIDTTNKNYPIEVMNGDNLNVAFVGDIPFRVNITGSTNYIYNTNTLSILNVTSDITVNRIYRFYEKILADNKNILNVGCPAMIGNYIRLTSIETGKKFCTAPDNYGTSYYFRGSTENNYVYFAGYYWRIIRINGDNTVRMIYAGTTPVANGVTTSSVNIGTSKYNSTYSDNTYAGYMYGTVGATNYNSAHSNLSNSALKTSIDNWYVSNLNKNDNIRYLADNLFCNDRTLYNNTDISTVLNIPKLSNDTGKGYGSYSSNTTYYAAYYRLIVPVEMGKTTNIYQSYATLKCAQKNDSFTKDDSVYGNAKLTYPVATITADEVMLAGALNATGYQNGGYINPANETSYLYNGKDATLITMTSSQQAAFFGAFALVDTGWLSGGGIMSTARGVRPVINIKMDTVIKSGNGTMSNPYVFE